MSEYKFNIGDLAKYNPAKINANIGCEAGYVGKIEARRCNILYEKRYYLDWEYSGSIGEHELELYIDHYRK